MNANSLASLKAPLHFEDQILEQGDLISKKLHLLSVQRFPPNAKKTLRSFSLSEVASYVGVSQSTLKKLHLEGKGPSPQTSSSGRRSYTAEQMLELRQYLDAHGRSESRMYVPHRRPDEKLQVIAVVNFKGGSGKTTTAAHLAQYLALTGHRVLAVDLDPQASLSSLHGFQPELDQVPSIYDAIRYDGERKALADIIQSTNFPGLDIVPANLDLQEYEYDTPLAMADKSSNEGRTFFTRIWLNAQDEDTIEHFAIEVAKLPQVMECYLMLGDCDAMVRVVAADIDDYRRFQSEHLSRIRGVQNVKTDVPSQTIKHTSELPV